MDKAIDFQILSCQLWNVIAAFNWNSISNFRLFCDLWIRENSHFFFPPPPRWTINSVDLTSSPTHSTYNPFLLTQTSNQFFIDHNSDISMYYNLNHFNFNLKPRWLIPNLVQLTVKWIQTLFYNMSSTWIQPTWRDIFFKNINKPWYNAY